MIGCFWFPRLALALVFATGDSVLFFYSHPTRFDKFRTAFIKVYIHLDIVNDHGLLKFYDDILIFAEKKLGKCKLNDTEHPIPKIVGIQRFVMDPMPMLYNLRTLDVVVEIRLKSIGINSIQANLDRITKCLGHSN